MRSFKSFTAWRLIESMTQKKMDWLLHQLAYHKARHKKDSAFQVWQEGSWSFPGRPFPSQSLGTRERLTKVKKSPSPLMGEGWGEGEKIYACQSVTFPSP
jgi:hypothetical protein